MQTVCTMVPMTSTTIQCSARYWKNNVHNHASEIINDLRSFTTGGSLRGEHVPSGARPGWGILPSGPWQIYFRSRVIDGHIDYVVYSYDTPIAWHDNEVGWIVPQIRYTSTTSIHQGKVRSMLAKVGVEYSQTPVFPEVK